MSGPFKMKGWSPFTKVRPSWSEKPKPEAPEKPELEKPHFAKPELEPMKKETKTGMQRTSKELKPKETNIVQSFIDFVKSKKK